MHIITPIGLITLSAFYDSSVLYQDEKHALGHKLYRVLVRATVLVQNISNSNHSIFLHIFTPIGILTLSTFYDSSVLHQDEKHEQGHELCRVLVRATVVV